MSAVAPSRSDLPVGPGEAEALFAPLTNEPALLAAVSGGPDSMALLVLLRDWAARPGRPALHAATVDHGLREAAAAEARQVAAQCVALGVPHVVLAWPGPKPQTGLQSRAREARYALLAGHARMLGGAAIVTAHTLDDQAETILMRLARGSGPAGLIGMAARVRKSGVDHVRPLLGIAKARLVATAQAQGLDVVSDPANADPRFARARWRQLMPPLAEEGLTGERLATLSARLARLDAAVERQVEAVLARLGPIATEGGLRLDFAALALESEEIVVRVIGRLLMRMEMAGDVQLRLERLETCVAALLTARSRGVGAARTLGGCTLAMTPDGQLKLAREPARRRSVHPAS